MWYRNEEFDQSGLKINPFHTIVSPRPIAWVSTLSEDGVPNLAPYAYFNAVSIDPDMIMISFCNRGQAHVEQFGFELNAPKDTFANISATREFCISMPTYEQAEQVNCTAWNLKPEVSEWIQCEVEMEPSYTIAPPRVKGSPVAIECVVHDLISLPPATPARLTTTLCIGLIKATYIDDQYIVDDRLNLSGVTTIGRLGFVDYCTVSDENIFTLQRPDRYSKRNY